MARRSASNERYGKFTAPGGKTRKSAAAAKPKRANAASPSSSKSSSSKGSGPKKREPMVYHPDTDEYRLWRRIWWACLGVAIVLTTISWFVMRAGTTYQMVGTVLLGAGYAAIAGALFIDFSKLRKLRQQWVASGKAVEAGKAAEQAKDDKAAQKAAQKAARAEESDAASDSGSNDTHTS